MALTNCTECGHGHVCHLTPSEQERAVEQSTLNRIVQVMESVDTGTNTYLAIQELRHLLRREGLLPPAPPRPARRREPVLNIETNPILPVTPSGGGGGGQGRSMGAPGVDSMFTTINVSSDSWLEMLESRANAERRTRERRLEQLRIAAERISELGIERL